MSKVQLQGNANGTGIFTIASPNSNTDRTLTLPDSTGTLLNNSSNANFPAGSVLQMVTSAITTANSTTSQTFVASASTASITPKSATSRILILCNAALYCPGDNYHVYTTIYRGSTNLAGSGVEMQLYSAGTSGSGRWSNGSLSYFDSPGTTSSTTYTVYYRSITAGQTVYYNGSAGSPATMILLEIAA